jgi:hypothetical protein
MAWTNHAALAIVWGAGVYHVIMGGASMTSVKLIRKLTGALYALDGPDELDPKFEYGIKPLGALAFVFGCLALRVAATGSDLEFFKACLALLLVLRAILRYLHSDLFERAFHVKLKRSWNNIALNLVLALILTLSISSIRLGA